MKTSFKIVFLFLLWTSSVSLFAQSSDKVVFEIDRVEHEGGKVVRLYFKALDADNSPIKIRYNTLDVQETIDGKSEKLDVYPDHVKDSLIIVKDTTNVEKYTATFLLDVSNKMSQADLEKAKRMIKDIFKKVATPNSTNFQLVTFGNKLNTVRNLTTKNLQSVLNNIRLEDQDPDFYNAVIHTIRDIKRRKDKKILFIFSNGFDDTKENSNYDFRIPYTKPDLIAQVKELGIDFYLFPITFDGSENESFLKDIVAQSGATDSFQKENLPANWQEIISNNEVVKSTQYVDVYTSKIFRGQEIFYSLSWKDQTDEKSYSKGTVTSDSQEINLAQFGMYSLFGLLILGGIVGACNFIVPFIRNRHFVKNFVRPYVPEGNLRKIDPITRDPIQAGELVVYKCSQITPIATWEGLGGQCPNYPDCMDFNKPCNGSGAPSGNNNFFSMQGEYRRLNWMWFGATGGFLAWTFLYIFKMLDFQWYQNLFSSLFTSRIINNKSSVSNTVLNNQLENLSNDTLAGAMFGLGLIFMLSWVEEKSQPRQISWGRIIARTVLGMLVSLLVFFVGFMLQFHEILPNGYVGGLFTWLLLGAVIGVVLSIQSSITMGRGVLGGLFAMAIAYHVYLLIGTFTSNFILGKLLSLILLGGILGWILNTVVTRLEDFELEYIAPKAFRNIVPISKWLKAGIDVFIGTESGSYIYIKWDDPAVRLQHAKLIYENGGVFIEPLAETLVAGKIIPEHRKTLLKNGDVIQLGRSSITKIKYKEKGRVATIPQSNGSRGPRPDDGKAKIRLGK